MVDAMLAFKLPNEGNTPLPLMRGQHSPLSTKEAISLIESGRGAGPVPFRPKGAFIRAIGNAFKDLGKTLENAGKSAVEAVATGAETAWRATTGLFTKAQSVKTIKPQFLLFSPNNRDSAFEISSAGGNYQDYSAKIRSAKSAGKFNTKRKTIFIVHGWKDKGNDGWPLKMKDAFLTRGDFNVISVNWKEGAKSLIYTQAFDNAPVVANVLALVANQLKSIAGASTGSMHIVGHSMGAHIAGMAGSKISGLGRISGLDPAKQNYDTSSTSGRLDKGDANFVDVIHSNTGNFGLSRLMGHVDFFPNRGSHQPGCVWAEEVFTFCSHQRAGEIFLSSINRACKSCCSYMGYDAISGSSRGKVTTGVSSYEPYCGS